jgi:hypothetical protein
MIVIFIMYLPGEPSRDCQTRATTKPSNNAWIDVPHVLKKKVLVEVWRREYNHILPYSSLVSNSALEVVVPVGS